MASKKPVNEQQNDVPAEVTADESSSEEQAAAEGSAGTEHEDPVKLLQDARRQAEDHWDKLLRTQAELENVRRRAERDLENAHKFALERFAGELLPVKDSLELGLAAVSGEAEDIARLREGIELTLKMLATAMEKFGITEVDPLGETFNPELHQAMSMQVSADQAPNTVIAVMQKGYLLNERLLRPAMVMVAKAPDEGSAGG
jgi:molecular chaperone GrpE